MRLVFVICILLVVVSIAAALIASGDEPLTGRVIDTNVSNDTESDPGVAPLSAGRLTRVDLIVP